MRRGAGNDCKRLLSVALAAVLISAIYAPIHMQLPQAMATRAAMEITNITTCEALPAEVTVEWIEPNVCRIVSGTLLVDGGVILRVASGVVLEIMSDGVIINNEGEITNQGNIINDGIFTNIDSGTMDNEGIFTNTGTVFTNVDSTGTFDNDEGGILLNQEGGQIIIAIFTFFSNHGNFTNDGEILNYGFLENYGTLDNSGTINTDGTIWNYDDAVLNNLEGGLINITGDEDPLLKNEESGTINNHGTISNAGTIDNDGAFNNHGITENECDAGVVLGDISGNPPEDGCSIEGPASGSISGFKFEDKDADGNWDTGEVGNEGALGGVEICAFGDALEVCDLTDQETGKYLLEDLPLDVPLEVYEQVPEGYEQTAPQDYINEETGVTAEEGRYFVTLDSEETLEDLNFGNTIIEVTQPAAPVITSPADGAIINNNMPHIEGTAEPGSLVRVFVEHEEDVTSLGTTEVDEVGNWTLPTSPALADGIHIFTATATDDADNESQASGGPTVTIDTALPSTPVLAAPVNNTNTADNTPTFDWSEAEDATAVTYELFVDDDSDFSSIKESQSGIDDLTFTFDGAFDDGTYHWKVRATDEAGNAGAFSSIFTFTVDTEGPLSVVPATESGPVDFVLQGGELESVAALEESALPDVESKPENVDFPFGFFSWTVTGLTPGQTITMTLDYPSNVAAGSSYWKIIGDEWVDASSLLGSNDGDETVTLTITDGSFGDADGEVNGEVSDPGGLGEVRGDLVIRKIKLGEPEVLLGGSAFKITPNPFALESESPLDVADNDENDSDPEDGIIEINGVAFATYTLVETTTPEGYERVVTSVTIVVNSGNLAPTVTVENRPAEQEIEQVVEVPPPQLDEDQVNNLGNNGATVNGQAVNSTNLPPAVIVPEDEEVQAPEPIIFTNTAPPNTNGSTLFSSFSIPTYPGPDQSIAGQNTYAPPAIVIPKDGGSNFVLTPVIEEVFEEMTMLLTPPASTATSLTRIQSVEIEFGQGGNGIGFSFDLSSEIPEGVPEVEDIEETALFLDVDFVGNVNFSNPSSFGSSPALTILVSRSLEGETLPDGCPDIALYLLNENTNEWEEIDTPERNPGGDTADECSYIVHPEHFSRFAIGGVTGTITNVSTRPGGGGGSRTVILDGTFTDSYFAVNPLARIGVAGTTFVTPSGQVDSEFAVGEQVQISTTIRNYQQGLQTYAFIVQILDENGLVQSISWQTGMLDRGQEYTVGQSWLAEAAGDYQVRIFVWNGLAAPDPLSGVEVRMLQVSDTGPTQSA